MVAVGGHRPVDSGVFYTNHSNYEATLLDIRTRMLETVDHRTRQTYRTTILNYGDVDQEMRSERTVNVVTPKTGATYSLQQGSPMFANNMFASNTRFTGLTAPGSGVNIVRYSTNNQDDFADLHVGQIVEINGEERTITAFTAPTDTLPGTITLAAALSQAPPVGSLLVFKGRDYVNPHLTETYRMTDQFGSYIVDDNRYQVDRNSGIVRYRPSFGSSAFNANSIWHPEAAVNVPYYFGKMVPVKQTPPPPHVSASLPIPPGAEELGAVNDPVASGSNGPIAPPGLGGVLSTTFGLPYPDGEYSNIRVSAPAGVSFEVELNGAKLAIMSNGGTVTIPFFDPNYQNDQLKANELIDPDVYIQRFIKQGNNHLVIKATETDSANQVGIRVEGFFNGVNLETGAIASNGADPHNLTNLKPHAAESVRTRDWSVSRHSVLGIAGKINFMLGDQIALEDANDSAQVAQGVLESLSTIIAGTDINQFQSLLSVIR